MSADAPGSALDLLSGDAQTFLAKVWASRVHVHHADPDALVGLLSLDDVDELLTSSAIRTPSVRIAQDGAVLPESSYTRGATLAGRPLSGLVDGRRALALFDGGATIVLQGLHRYWPALTALIAELELELGHPCQANAYLTPPGAQGFAVHSDSHDVFVFQTAGSKQWEVHTPDGVEEPLLVPGISMYLPTGTPHAARAQDTVSLHVTLGINQLTWRGLVERSVRDVLAGVSDEHLPAGWLDDPDRLADELGRRLELLAGNVRNLDAGGAVDAEVRRFLTTRPSRLAGGLHDVLAAGDLADGTLLRRRAGHPCVLLAGADPSRVEVLLGDRSLDVPARIRPALEEVRSRRELRPSDLADHLDEQSRLVLCRRLVREGLLEVVR
ncbi:cupin [Nocardioides sp. KIGAM211]|uniref:Cupin n=1 Tax=Nocardioides luti TaxID=2761101 RepID=A0A7X0VBE4_9ACTN|nr:cupin [Nocardioides luti]